MLRRKWGWMTKMHAFYNPLNAQNRIRLTAFFSLQGCQKNNFVIQPNLLKPLQFTCSRNTLLKPINPSLYVCVLPHAHTKTEPTEEFSCGVEPRGAYQESEHSSVPLAVIQRLLPDLLVIRVSVRLCSIFVSVVSSCQEPTVRSAPRDHASC